jgi:hypothetical protein
MPGFPCAICADLQHTVSFRGKVAYFKVAEDGGSMVRARGHFGGLAKQRSGWVAPAIAFFVTACLSAVVFAYYFAPGPPGLGEEFPEPTDATRPVALTIGSTRFRIPANYVLLTSARRGGTLSEVALAAMLPRLEGYSLSSAKEFAGNTADSPIINLKIRGERAPLSEGQRLDRIYRFQVEDQQGEKQADGLMRFSFRPDSGYRGQELFSGDIDGQPIVILCDRTAPDTPSPNCLRDIPYGEGLGLSYRFKRAHLARWREIDDTVKELLGGFAGKN